MFPYFEEIDKDIYENMLRGRTQSELPKKSVFIRAVSGADDGLILESNPNIPLLAEQNILGLASGPSVYGTKNQAGSIGIDWNGKFVNSKFLGKAGRPGPIITQFFVKEGKDQLSREATLNISCYSLEQLDLIQKYFMEPGYTLFIEWGWNTTNGKIGFIQPNSEGKITQKEILAAANSRGLNFDTLKSVRKKCKGDYDCYFGFITGGNVKSENDIFNISILMNGVPSLPTWLQSHNQTFSIDKTTGEANSNNGIDSYPNEEIGGKTSYKASDEKTLMQRRFKSMFNQLPPQRQTLEVKKLMDSCKSGWFINFDEPVTNTINFKSQLSWPEFSEAVLSGRVINFSLQQGISSGLGDVIENIKTENGTIPKSIFKSTDRYIKFNLAMDILNANGNLLNYEISGVPVSIKIDTSDVILPSFPMIFSTKREKLLIPGNIPNFTLYFDNTTFVNQKDLYEDTGAGKGRYTNIKEEFGGSEDIEFNEIKSTPDGLEITEEANYWGYLNNLYVNFDFFKNVITQPNKNLREILEDLLNGMSEAVNSIWNFQIIEKNSKNGILTFKIVDENWSGLYNKVSRKFQHSGMRSVFLEANLDISISAEMTNGIIARRSSLAVNPNQAIVDTGTFFTSKNDRFLKINKNEDGINSSQPPSEPDATKRYASNLSRLFLVPHPSLDWASFDTKLPQSIIDLNTQYIIATFDDTNLFDVIRNKYFYKYKISKPNAQRASPLLPIKYSFRTWGISGIERGNVFNIDGIPKKYQDNGFFQITEYEQDITSNGWFTTINGEYRQFQ